MHELQDALAAGRNEEIVRRPLERREERGNRVAADAGPMPAHVTRKVDAIRCGGRQNAGA